MKKEYFEPTQESGAALFKRNIGDPECMAGIGHRTAAIADSRLLPIVENAAAT